MPLLVQHVVASEVRLAATAVAFPATFERGAAPHGGSRANVAILAPARGRDPYRVALQAAQLSISQQETHAQLAEVEVEAAVGVRDGQCVVPCVVAPAVEAEGNAGALNNSTPARHLFLFGGERRANEHDAAGCSADTVLINAETGAVATLIRPSAALLALSAGGGAAGAADAAEETSWTAKGNAGATFHCGTAATSLARSYQVDVAHNPAYPQAKTFAEFTPDELRNAADFIGTQLNVETLPEDLANLLIHFHINEELKLVVSNKDGTHGPYGRYRLEGFVYHITFLTELWAFIKSNQNGSTYMKVMSYFIYEGIEVVKDLTKRLEAMIEAGEGDETKNQDLLDMLKEQQNKLQEIRAHSDFPPREEGLRMLKAVLMHTSNESPSIWDFYVGDPAGDGVGQLVATLEIPSNSCLFISDAALGMLLVRFGGKTARIRHAVRAPASGERRKVMQAKLEGLYNQVV